MCQCAADRKRLKVLQLALAVQRVILEDRGDVVAAVPAGDRDQIWRA
jgi:hypothetical protein